MSLGSIRAEKEEEEEEAGRRVSTRSQLALLRAPFPSTADVGTAAAGIAKGIDAQYKQVLHWSMAGAEGWLHACTSFSREMYTKAHIVQNIISPGRARVGCLAAQADMLHTAQVETSLGSL